jgi:hypothetical protein
MDIAEGVPMLIAQTDDPELLEWLSNAHQRGGGFVSSLAGAALRADHENYSIIRPLVLQMREKYPAYEPSEAVKADIKAFRKSGAIAPFRDKR